MNDLFDKILNALNYIADLLEPVNRKLVGRSSTLDFFSGNGVFKFSIIPSQFNEKGFVEKEGALYIEAAGTTGKKNGPLPEYDWKNKKVTFAMNLVNIYGLLEVAEGIVPEYSNQHKSQPNAEKQFNKMFRITAPNPNFDKYKLSLSDQVTGVSVSVPLTPGQMIVLADVAKRLAPQLAGLVL